MSKTEENIVDAAAEVVESAEEVVAAEPKVRGARQAMITVDGVEISRRQYCQDRANAGATRAEITAELCEITGTAVPYQVVFAATKGLYASNPKKAKKAETTEALATEVEAVEEEPSEVTNELVDDVESDEAAA